MAGNRAIRRTIAPQVRLAADLAGLGQENAARQSGFWLYIPEETLNGCHVLSLDTPTRVRAEVVATTKNMQVPWSNSSLLGEVYLADR
jgi:hypothetical protein